LKVVVERPRNCVHRNGWSPRFCGVSRYVWFAMHPP
jgi:hypothetical protein